MSWKQNATFLTPDYIEHPIEGSGTMRKFYPVSVRTAFNMHRIAGPLAQALTVLFGGGRSDGGSKHMKYGQPDPEDPKAPVKEFGEETVINATPLDTSRYRDAQRQQAITALIATIADANNQLVLGHLIWDSMREEFEPRTPKDADVNDMLDSIDVTVLSAMLVGVAKANVGVLGPLAAKISKKVQSDMEHALTPEVDPAAAPATTDHLSSVLEGLESQAPNESERPEVGGDLTSASNKEVTG